MSQRFGGDACDGEMYDLIWQGGLLGIRFTPNEFDLPVVCFVRHDDPHAAVATVLPKMAIGDVLVAFRVHASTQQMEQVESFEQFIDVLQRAELPITMRFRSRKLDQPSTFHPGDIERTYSFCWPTNEALGVSMGVDPVTLLAVIVAIDPERISNHFRELEPMIGDALVEITSDNNGSKQPTSIRTDQQRYEETVNLLRTLPRPCTLRFVRFKTANNENESPNGAAALPPASSTTKTRASSAPPPLSAPAALGGPRKALPRLNHPKPLTTQKSFKVDEREEEMKRFYEVTYAGGAIGLVMKENKQYPQGYHCFVMKINDKKGAPGLENTCVGDELVAIGRKDLKGMSFDQVMHDLRDIQSPTRLLFRRPKRQVSISTVGILTDALLMFLM